MAPCVDVSLRNYSLTIVRLLDAGCPSCHPADSVKALKE